MLIQAKPCFPIFPMVNKHFFAKGGHGPVPPPPPQYSTAMHYEGLDNCRPNCIVISIRHLLPSQTVLINQMFCGAPPLTKSTESLYSVHVIRNTAHRPSTQTSYIFRTKQVGYDQTKTINCCGANCSQTHNIISLLVPDEFNVIIRTTTDEFNCLTSYL